MQVDPWANMSVSTSDGKNWWEWTRQQEWVEVGGRKRMGVDPSAKLGGSNSWYGTKSKMARQEDQLVCFTETLIVVNLKLINLLQ